MSMLGGWFDKIVDFVVGFFAFIPQLMYFLYTSVASLLDLFQYLVRKLAGLDTYWMNGQEVGGDIITQFLRGILGIDKTPAYSALSTVFWSLVVFGVILLVLSTIIAIIKAHYNYDANKSSPTKILGTSLKSLATMAIVPIVAIFGVYLSQILLKALDSITSPGSAAVLNETFESTAFAKFKGGEDKQGYATYNSYDYFGMGEYTTSSTFSGMMFKVAAYNCNRVRTNQYRILNSDGDAQCWDNMGVFFVAADKSDQKERLANQIDVAFANNLKLQEPHAKVKIEGMGDAGSLWSSLRFGYSATLSAGLFNVQSFSKFNVGLVWYYYNLWGFNWILGFAGIVICATLLGNIVFGLMTRLLQVVALFIIFPALIGIMPLDERSAFSNWRKQFTADILMAFGAIVGMNIFFLILPFFNSITFFNPKDGAFLNAILNMIIALAGLTLIKKFIGMVSKFVGGTDANETGAAVMKDVQGAAMKGLSGTMKAATPALKMMKPIVGIMKVGSKAIGNKIVSSRNSEASIARRQGKMDKKINEMMDRSPDVAVSDEERRAYMNFKSLDKKERNAVLKDYEKKMEKADLISNPVKRADARALANSGLVRELGGYTKGAKAEASQAALAGHQQKVYDRAVTKTENRYKRATTIGKLFGQDTSKYKKGTVSRDENGNVVVQKGTASLKGAGQAIVDFSQALGKSFANITGASDAWKKLDDAGVVDAAKTNLKSLAETFNLPLENSEGKAYKAYQTKKAKDDAEKDALKAMRADQLKKQEAIEENTKKTTQAVEELTKKLENFMKNYPGPGGGGTTH